MKIDGRAIAAEIINSLKPQVESLKTKGIIPTLAIILIGQDESSKSYIKQKELRAQEIGAEIKLFHFQSIDQDKLLDLIKKLNIDPKIHGIIVQRPLPDELDSEGVSKAIDPNKDVDGFNPISRFNAPVAEAVVEILKLIGESDLRSREIVVIGRGETAGGPIIKLLLKLGAEPLVVDSRTQNSEEKISSADIIISAAGKEHVIKAENLNRDQVLIGVGLFLKEGRLKGDYDESEVSNKVKYYTPTIGGVGPINVAMLLRNLLKAI